MSNLGRQGLVLHHAKMKRGGKVNDRAPIKAARNELITGCFQCLYYWWLYQGWPSPRNGNWVKVGLCRRPERAGGHRSALSQGGGGVDGGVAKGCLGGQGGVCRGCALMFLPIRVPRGAQQGAACAFS